MDLESMLLRIEVLFTQDSEGRLLAHRQLEPRIAPRFYLGRSRYGNVWRFREDLPPDSIRSLARLAAREAPLPDLAAVDAPPERMQSFRDVLERGGPIAGEYRGPAFAFPTPLPQPPTGPGRLVALANRLQPCIGLELDGSVVSVCETARRSPGRGAEAGVETLDGHRGCGHAPRVVAAWARALSELGETPFYSTTWQNHASRAVARKLGLIRLGEDLHFS